MVNTMGLDLFCYSCGKKCGKYILHKQVYVFAFRCKHGNMKVGVSWVSVSKSERAASEGRDGDVVTSRIDPSHSPGILICSDRLHCNRVLFSEAVTLHRKKSTRVYSLRKTVRKLSLPPLYQFICLICLGCIKLDCTSYHCEKR